MRGGPVVDLNAYGEAAQAFLDRTGHLLTIEEYCAITQGSPAPVLTAIMAAEFSRQNADAQADHDTYREEMSLGGRPYDPNEASAHHMSRGRKV